MAMNSRSKSIASWALSGLLALMFVVTGASKVADVPPSPANFARWGHTPAFMHAVGALELVCAVGLLVPRLAPLAALVLFGLMAGALRTGLVHHEALHIVLPLVLMVLLILVTYLRLRFRHKARPTAG
jgi:uncharacterized membrane protein YphA (DoxX/SURF4 family)